MCDSKTSLLCLSLSSTMENDYYQSRGDDGTLRLIRRTDTTQSTSTSFYCCQLPNAMLFLQTLCVTIGKPAYINNSACMLYHNDMALHAAVNSPGVWLSLDGQLYSNNSAVELRELYESQDDSHTLMCVTPKRPCCASPPHRFGEWYYPNRSAVSIYGMGNSFYRDRGNDGTVRLHRRGIASLSAAMGQYCCEIPNANDITQRLCVHFSKLAIACACTI